MEILGAPVGFDRAAISNWCKTQVTQHDSYFSMLQHHCMPSHHALLLLKSSLRPRLNFLLRCVPPALFSTALQSFEEKTQLLFRTKITPSAAHDRISSFAARHMALPYRAGGIGLTETLTTSHAAFTASCALAIPDIAPLILQDEQARHCPTFADILESSAFLTRAGVNVPLPTSTQEILDFYSDGDSEKHLQGDLMTNYYDSCLNNLFDDPQASDADIACLIASQTLRNGCT